jgi:signal transduction histidine kinase
VAVLKQAEASTQEGRAADRLAVTEVVSRIALPGSNLQRRGTIIAQELRRSMSIDWAGIALIAHTPEGEDRVRICALSPEIECEWELGDTIPLKGTPLEWVMNNRKPLAEADLRRKSFFWTGAALGRQGITSAAYAPLFACGAVFGCLIVGSKTPRACADIESLKRAATKLAVDADQYRAVEELRMRAETEFAGRLDEEKRRAAEDLRQAEEDFAAFLSVGEDRTKERAMIDDLVRILRLGDGPSRSFPEFAQHLSMRVPFDHISFASIQGEKVVTYLSASLKDVPPRAGDTYLLKDCAASWVTEHQRPLVAQDLATARHLAIDDLQFEHGMRSSICLPLTNRDGVFATLNLAIAEPHAYGAGGQRFLEDLCSHLSPASESIALRQNETKMMEFLTSVSHEAKTPLTSIVSSVRLLVEELSEADKDCPEDSPRQRLLQNILNSAELMKVRISNFVDLARIESVDFRLSMEPVYIETLLEEVVEVSAAIAKVNGQSLYPDLPRGLPQVKGNLQRLKQVMSTLLNNACTFSPKGGSIKLRARTEDEFVIIEVQNSGDGFTSEEQKELFRPYHPITDTKRFQELSLDLAIARQLVQLHGGELHMESEVGQGSTFVLSLPIAS